MGTIYVASDDPYLDVSPTVLLVIASVLVGLLIACLVSGWALGWIRTHFDRGRRP
jgi:UPF0716 family protein affecting phage T7 exclusion